MSSDWEWNHNGIEISCEMSFCWVSNIKVDLLINWSEDSNWDSLAVLAISYRNKHRINVTWTIKLTAGMSFAMESVLLSFLLDFRSLLISRSAFWLIRMFTVMAKIISTMLMTLVIVTVIFIQFLHGMLRYLLKVECLNFRYSWWSWLDLNSFQANCSAVRVPALASSSLAQSLWLFQYPDISWPYIVIPNKSSEDKRYLVSIYQTQFLCRSVI